MTAIVHLAGGPGRSTEYFVEKLDRLLDRPLGRGFCPPIWLVSMSWAECRVWPSQMIRPVPSRFSSRNERDRGASATFIFTTAKMRRRSLSASENRRSSSSTPSGWARVCTTGWPPTPVCGSSGSA